MNTYKSSHMIALVITSITVLVIVIMMILTQKKMKPFARLKGVEP